MADAGESSASKYSTETVGGGGGKLRRERKPPPTPYDRPSTPSSRWISRFVDPAKRIFSGLPSIFSPSLSSKSADEVQIEVGQEDGDAEENYSVDLVAPKSTEGVGPSEVKGKSKLDTVDEDGLDKKGHCSDGGVPDIEQLIKGKTFSREEINHLMKILSSRVAGAEQDRKIPRMSGLDEVERAETSSEKHKSSVNEEEELNRFQLATPTSLQRPTMQDGVGASPVDIARAYMGSRNSEMGFTSTSIVPKTEKFGFTSEFSSKPIMSSPLRKAPICWPGAITQNQPDYPTPPIRNNRSGLHSFSRTPYSRTMYSQSKSKLTPLRGDSERFPSISPAPFQPTGTPFYGKSVSNMTEGSYASGGPIRRNRNKFTSATPARESTLFSTARRSPLARESNVDFTPKKNFEPGSSSAANLDSVHSKAKSPDTGVRSSHPHSSRLARQILEQLDRPITLKEKSKELKLAASWKDSSAATLATPVQNMSSPSSLGVGIGKNKYVDGVILSAQANRESNVLPWERNNTVSGAGKDIFGSVKSLDKTTSISGANIGPNASLGKFDSERNAEQGINNNNSPKTSMLIGDSQYAQRKPVLPSIAIEKSRMQTTSFASATTPGFTFPFSTSSTTSVEPPTPSMMPSFLTSAPQQSKLPTNLPTSTSANKITIAPPVVASPPKTTASTSNDTSSPMFKFGSGKPRLSFAVAGDDVPSASNDAAIPKFKFGSGKSRLNFGSIGSDAVCC